MKRLFLLIFGVILAITGSTFSQDTIKIGEFGSLTGDNASFGISQNNGVQMAAEEINAAGGVLGKKIELIVEDNQTKQGETTTIARKLISQDHVVSGHRRGGFFEKSGGGAHLPSLQDSPDRHRGNESKSDPDWRLHIPRLFHG